MEIQRTLSIIKPDATSRDLIGKINGHLEFGGLSIIASRMMHLTKEQAEGFYAVHKDRPFFNSLVEYMISGPILVQVLEGEDAIARNREIMGATNPFEAADGSIRAKYGESLQRNSVHGSDAVETARIEIAYFFSEDELHSRR